MSEVFVLFSLAGTSWICHEFVVKKTIKVLTMDQVLQARVEEVIKEFNEAVEEGEARMGKLKMIVMKEAKAVIETLEDAEAKRQEELGRKMNELIEKLTGDLEVVCYT